MRLAFLILFALPVHLLAGGDLPAGARHSGLAGTFSAIRHDPWCLNANPSGITGIKKSAIGLSASRQYLLREFSAAAFVAAVPFQEKHALGISVSAFGFELYQLLRFGISYSAKIQEKVAAGIQFQVPSLYIHGYGSRQKLNIRGGFGFQLSPGLYAAFHASGLLLEKKTETKTAELPQMHLGIAWKCSRYFQILSECTRTPSHFPSFRMAFEYLMHRNFALRAGVANAPVLFSAGFGLISDKLRIDFAFQYYQVQGISPELSINTHGSEQ